MLLSHDLKIIYFGFKEMKLICPQKYLELFQMRNAPNKNEAKNERWSQLSRRNQLTFVL